jgi:glycerophosphoryl diester phosphodiesterase
MIAAPWRWIVLIMFATGASPAYALKLIGHRGASADAPENTLAAFRLAFEQGADGIEGDFYLTADGQVVCLHDADTGRTGDKNLPVATSTLAELRTVDVGAKKGARFQGERIPTLPEVLAVVPAEKQIYLEVKCGPEIVPVLRRDVEASQLRPEQIAIISFSPEAIAAVRQQMPTIRTLGLAEFNRQAESGGPQPNAGSPSPNQPARWQPDMPRVLEMLKRTGASGIGAGGPLAWFSKEHLRALREAGFEVHCWTIDDETTARALQTLGVDSITTNRPATLRKWLFADEAAK